MKKFIIAFILGLFTVGLSSCSCSNENEPFGIEYNLTSDGMTDGHVTVVIPTGEFMLHGNADYQLVCTNVDTLYTDNTKLLKESIVKGDNETVKAASYVDNWLDKSIYISDYSGSYDVYVKGFVKETKTGITFSIDRHFTNITEDESIDCE